MQAILALEDGRIFRGKGYGARGECYGEVVFNTSITGYQEIFTDPSYSGQIVVLTTPEIGNYGTNPEDNEANHPYIEGLVVREFSKVSSNWRSQQVAEEYLEQFKIPVLAEIDTRALVRHLRDHGVMRGVISTMEADPEKLVAKALSIPKMDGTDLAKVVSTTRPYVWEVGERSHEPVAVVGVKDEPPRFHVVAYDFGIKQNILRKLRGEGCKVTVVPAQTPAEDVLALKPDGVFLSNGPGDPEPCTYAVDNIRRLMGRQPIFGICLGHQLTGLGARWQDLQAEVRPPRRQPAGEAAGHRARSRSPPTTTTSPSIRNRCRRAKWNSRTSTSMTTRWKACAIASADFQRAVSPRGRAGPHDARYLFKDFVKMMEEYRS